MEKKKEDGGGFFVGLIFLIFLSFLLIQIAEGTILRKWACNKWEDYRVEHKWFCEKIAPHLSD